LNNYRRETALLGWKAHAQHQKVRGLSLQDRNAVNRIIVSFEVAHRTQALGMRRCLELDEAVCLNDQFVFRVRAKGKARRWCVARVDHRLHKRPSRWKHARDNFGDPESPDRIGGEMLNLYARSGGVSGQ